MVEEAFGVLSVWICVGVFSQACFLVWPRTTMKAAKCDQHCELRDSVSHLKVERMLLFRPILESMLSCVGSNCDEGDSEV